MLIDVQIHVNANSRISRVLESAPICLQFGGLLARQPSRRHLHLPSARLSDMSDSWEDGGSPEASELELFQQEVVEAAAFRQSNTELETYWCTLQDSGGEIRNLDLNVQTYRHTSYTKSD